MGKNLFKDAVKYVERLKKKHQEKIDEITENYDDICFQNAELEKKIQILNVACDQSSILQELAELQTYCLTLKKEIEVLKGPK